MNITIQLAVVTIACLCLADGASEIRLTRAKQQRPTRGFKNVEMMTARGFGKRDGPRGRSEPTQAKERRKLAYHHQDGGLKVALDYGKRSEESDDSIEEFIRKTRGAFKPNASVLVARGYGKRNEIPDKETVYNLDNIWELLEAQERDGQNTDDKPMESIPLDWFVNEMLNNPDFTRSVIRKFIDINQDGALSPDELLRNTI